jgi:hypothetical protein
MSDLEYEYFGPWVVEISEADPPSPLFLPFLTRKETPILSVKIPRKIETRNARPGMNLYDFLVSLYHNDLVILQRSGESVKEHTFQYRDIQYLRYGEDLLKGTVQLGLPDKYFDLPFNTVSGSLMQRLVSLIRERFSTVSNSLTALEEPSTPVEGLSYYFNGLLIKKEIHEPQFCLLAAQANKPIASFEPDGFGKIFYRVIGKILLESLHLSDGRELKIITRGQDYKYKWQANYAKEFTYLPLEKISNVRWQSDTRHTAVSHLTFETLAAPLTFIFTDDNPFISTYTEFLKSVLISFNRKEGFADHQLSYI